MGAENQALGGHMGAPALRIRDSVAGPLPGFAPIKKGDKLHMLPQARRSSVPAHWGIQLNSRHSAQHPLPLQSCWSRRQRLPEDQEVPGS